MGKPVSIRLTNELRTRIVSALLKDVFGTREERAKKVESDLAAKVLNWHIGDKNLALMKQLPATYFMSESHINVRATDVTSGLDSTEGFRVPAELQYGRWIELPATHGMWKEIRASEAELEAISVARVEVNQKANGLLAGVNTVSKLLETWPEAAAYLPTFAEKTNLPAVRAEELNGMIAKLKK
jgi:hypothetical protein